MEKNTNYTLPQLLKALMDQGGSDLHLSIHSPPRLRINGDLFALDLPALTEAKCKELCYSVLTQDQQKIFEEKQEMDLAFSVKGLARFRANIFKQKMSVGGAFRSIAQEIPSITELSLPPILSALCEKPRGLILITGPTGSGKSTTLAAMIDHINTRFMYHIITIEDPIEYIHTHKKSMINQRELGADTHSFSNALKSSLRQDPDVVLVGELRDLETIQMALTAAETGHLVFGTLHTNSAVSTITRIIDVFPSHQQMQIRTQLSFVLLAVISQLLVPNTLGKRSPCLEIMIPNTAIKNLIREDKTHQIYSTMQMGQDKTHMKTLNQSIFELLFQRKITAETALMTTSDQSELIDMVRKNKDLLLMFKPLGIT